MTKGRSRKICDICEKIFENKSNLNRHTKKFHKIEKEGWNDLENVKREVPLYNLYEDSDDNDYKMLDVLENNVYDYDYKIDNEDNEFDAYEPEYEN